jgi:hypothetical protein
VSALLGGPRFGDFLAALEGKANALP